MDKDKLLAVSLVLMLLTLPLVSYGTVNDVTFAWWLGLALLFIGGLIPPVSRFALSGNDGDKQEKEKS